MANELMTAKPWELLHSAADLLAPAFMHCSSYTLPNDLVRHIWPLIALCSTLRAATHTIWT